MDSQNSAAGHGHDQPVPLGGQWGVPTLTQEEMERPGGRLLAALFRQAHAKGHSVSDLTRALGCSYADLMPLQSEEPRKPYVTDDVFNAMANYLSVMPITVKALAEVVTLADFVMPDGAEDAAFERAFEQMAHDPLLGGFMPPSLRRLSSEEKRFVVACYEQACGVELTPAKVLPNQLVFLLTALMRSADITGH